jgi:tRNA dimethylallyltransferase
MRALAFKRSTGESIIQYRTGERKIRPFTIIKVALELPRESLYSRINHRVDHMMEAGLLEEVRALQPYKHLRALQTVGYAELFDYLDGNTTLEAAIDKIKQHTRNYAKRQLTWLRREAGIVWLRADDADVLQKITGLISLP